LAQSIPIDPAFQFIRKALIQLRETANPVQVFGAEVHGFQINPPLTEQAVRDFEERYRTALPAEYRSFLLEIGNGGAGPAYGLFRLGEMDNAFKHKRWRENDGFIGILSRPFPHTKPWNDLSDEPDDAGLTEDEYEERLTDWERRYWNPENVNGAMPICHLGCAYRQWLVVCGPEVGNVWNDNRADRGGLAPLHQRGRERVTFLQWYNDWLEEALQQVGIRK